MKKVIILSEQNLKELIIECIQEQFTIHDLLTEHGEIMTYDINVTRNSVIKVLGIDPRNFKIVNISGVSIARIRIPPYIFDNLNKLMKRSGYFCSNPPQNGIDPYMPYIFQYEPKFESVNLRSLINRWKYIYHVSPYYAYENIMKIGFCPACKSKTFEYPPRNYFFGGNMSYNDLVSWATQFAIHKIMRHRNNKDNGHGNNSIRERNQIWNSQSKYVIYIINTVEIPANVEFYADPNLSGAYFTKENIPSKCIAGTKIIDLTKEIINNLKP